MRKSILFLTSLFVLIMSIILMNSCKDKINSKEYLKKVLSNLEQIKSATYFSRQEQYSPGDTAPSAIYYKYIKTYSNPADTFVGASFIILLQEDTTKMDYLYAGKMRARVNWEEKFMEIDSFKHNPWPFRPVNAPFFTKAQYLIKYALETKDSTSLKSNDFGDSIHYSLTIYH